MTRILDINSVDTFDILIRHLKVNKIAIIPCDTIYGIVGLAPITQPKIVAAKNRDNEKQFIELITLRMANEIAKSKLDDKLLKYWPGALTLIVEDSKGVSRAIRVPDDPFLLKLIEELKQPIYSSSVNISNQSYLVDFDEIVAQFDTKIELFIKGPLNKNALPSTILDVRSIPYTLLRVGSVDVKELLTN